MTCPKCNENKAHRSHRHGVNDYMRQLFQMTPYRCQGCNNRFYAFRGGELSSKLRTHEERKIMQLRRRIKWQRTKKELVVYGVGLVLAVGILYLLMQQRVSGE